MANKVALIIMDGWGHGKEDHTNAIYKAYTPFVESLYKRYLNCELITHGQLVGLPEGQMGNSEVGHLNIGAGRIVYQELARINQAINSGALADNEILQKAFNYAKTNRKKVHLMGLVSDGGVHSHIAHLKALCDIAHQTGVHNLYVHAFTDGRDTDPKSGISFLTDLQNYLQPKNYSIANVIGRYYAMDRDNRWERIKVAYDLLTAGVGEATHDILKSMEKSYKNGVTDEFIKPIIKIDGNGNALTTIEEDDVVISFNFRTDRCRQITRALTQQNFPEYGMSKIALHYVTMTKYDDSFENIYNLFEEENLKNTLGEVLEKHSKKQVRIAETEKYPHVTFFFSGGREKEFEGEKRIMIPSPKVATYDLQPTMSAMSLRDAIIKELKTKEPDFICINFANADMVGHTGIFDAVVKAVETVDQCVEKVVDTALENGYTILLTADHGNADFMINPDGSPNTAHTKNPVPFFSISNNQQASLKNGKLADIAPTILSLMDIPQPSEMTGEVLL